MAQHESDHVPSFFVKDDELDASRRAAWEKRRYRVPKILTFLVLALWALLLINFRGKLQGRGLNHLDPDSMVPALYASAWVVSTHAIMGLVLLAILMCRSWSLWIRITLFAGLLGCLMLVRPPTRFGIQAPVPLSLYELFTRQGFSLLLWSPALLVFEKLPPLGRSPFLHSIPGRMLPPMVLAWFMALVMYPG